MNQAFIFSGLLRLISLDVLLSVPVYFCISADFINDY
jgi:hypothetical protein